MRVPHLSLVIASYNSEATLGPLLDSIFASKHQNYEVIIVDDLSKDATRELIVEFQKKHKNLIYHRAKKRKGTGGAKNVGAKKASGKLVVFADSDVILYPNTLSQIIKSFQKKGVKAVIGTYDKVPANPDPSWFHYFKAMRDYAYWNIEQDEKLPIGGFGSWISAIDRKFFWEIGGFDESYKGAGMEDQEIAWRINQDVEIVFNPKIKVRHNFDSFLETFKKFIIRTFLWTKLYAKYREFFGPAMNPKEVLIAGLANLSTLSLLLSLFFPVFWIVFFAAITSRVLLGRRFLFFVIKQRGFVFLLPSLFFSHGLYLAVYLGAARAIIGKPSILFGKMLGN